MEPIRLEQIVRIVSGSWRGSSERRDVLSRLSTDTRLLESGDLYVGLRGERFDGGSFAEAAVEQGAGACIVERQHASRLGDGPWIFVDDSLVALEKLAVFNRDRLQARVTAITGSVGKTTTKEFLGSLLGVRYQTVVAPKSYNNRIGVALTLLLADQDTEQLVVEMGTSSPGEISGLSRSVRPDAAVVTQVAAAHLSGLKDIDGVIEAKCEIFDGMDSRGCAYLNADMTGLDRFSHRAPGEVRLFGLESGDYVLEDCSCQISDAYGPASKAGYTFRVQGENLFLPVIGRHNVLNAVAAIAVARDQGLGWDDIRQGLAECHLPPQRLQINVAGGVLFIDDSYNANPTSMSSALNAWTEIPRGEGQKFAVLGDMFELGDESRRLHEIVGREVADVDLDVLVTIGSECQHLSEACADNLPESRSSLVRNHFEEPRAADVYLRNKLRPGDQVLFKGSNVSGVKKLAEGLRRWAIENSV